MLPSIARWRRSIRRPIHRPEALEGAIDGLNLFFGALLGANLGTVTSIRLVDYVQLIVLLAGTVITVRMIAMAGARRPMLLLLGVYVALLVGLVALPGMAPAGLAEDDLHRLVATLGIWVAICLGLAVARLRAERTSTTVGETA